MILRTIVTFAAGVAIAVALMSNFGAATKARFLSASRSMLVTEPPRHSPRVSERKHPKKATNTEASPRPTAVSEDELLRACDAYMHEIYFAPNPESLADRAVILKEFARRSVKNTGQPPSPAEDRHDGYHLADKDDDVDRITVLCDYEWKRNAELRDAIAHRLYGNH